MRPQANEYLTGLYEPVLDERTDTSLVILGEMPEALSGTYVQNNPNPFFPPEGRYHWFDGDGMVHGVNLSEGRATYRNRYVQTEGLAMERDAGRPLWRGIMEPIDFENPRGPDKNTGNTDLVAFGGQLLALWWLGGVPYQVDPVTLETLGTQTFGGSLGAGVAAHPKVCSQTGELIFFDYSPYQTPYLQVGVISPEGRQVHLTEVALPGPRLLHDIAITPRYTILLDLPMVWDPKAVAKGRRKVDFERDRPSRFGLLPRKGAGAEVRWFEADPCYVYHTINAWESNDAQGHEIVHLLGCRIDDPIPTRPHDEEPDIPRLTFLRLQPFLTLWRFNLTTGAVTEEKLDDVATEFPRMNDAFLGVKSRFSYHPRLAKAKTLLFDGVIKYDTDRGTSEAYTWGPNHIGGETVYVPRPGGTAEDDGFVMTFVTDRREETSRLVVLSAQDISGGPIAEVLLPRRVPMGFHADFAPLYGAR